MESSIWVERVFLSCVSSEFAIERGRLANHLRALVSRRFEVVVQEDLQQGGYTLLECLADCIRDCDLVIHVVGHQRGACPSPEDVASLCQRLALPLPDGAPDRSYTQWEYELARHFDKPTLVYIASKAMQPDAPDGEPQCVEGDHDMRCQQEYVQALCAGGEHRSSFDGTADLVRRVLHDLGRDGLPLAKASNILFKPLGSLFKGRDAFLAQIRQALDHSRRGGTHADAITATATAACVHGLGGIGKTRAAIEFAHRHADDYTALLMIRADSPRRLDEDLAQLCGPLVLGLPEQQEPSAQAQVAAAIGWLRTHPGWLLIIDNADTEAAAAAVERLLELLGDTGQVLITSRVRNWSASVSTLEMDVLALEDSTAFLLERTEAGRVHAPDDADKARHLAGMLGRLALALEQAGAHMAREHLGFDDYLARWLTSRAKVLAWFDARTMRYPASVAVTWLTTFEQLGEQARTLMRTLACLAPDPVPRSIFEDESAALTELASFSMLKWNDAQSAFSVHTLVQEVTRLRMQGTALAEALSAATARLADGFAGDTRDPSSRPLMDLLAPHGAWVVEALSRTLALEDGDPSTRAILTRADNHIALAARVGSFHLRSGRYDAAVMALEQVLQWRQTRPGDEDVTTLQAMHHLATAKMHQGDLPGARALQTHVVDMMERVHGKEHPETLSGMLLLASIMGGQGELAAACALEKSVMHAQQRLFGEDHADTLKATNNLSRTLKALGDLQGARILQDKLADACARVFGSDHPETLTALGGLASTVLAQGDLSRARQLQEHVLDHLRRALGDEHPRTLVAMADLAVTLHAQGDTMQSLQLHGAVLRARLNAWGDNHPDTLTAMSNYATALHEQGDYAVAHQVEESVLAARRKAFGESHPATLTSMSNLAATLRAQGDLPGAQALLEQVLAGRQKLFGDDGLDTLTTLGDLARVKGAQGDAQAEQQLLDHVLTARRRLLGDEHPQTLDAAESLGVRFAANNEDSKARELLEPVVRVRLRLLGEEHPDTLRSMNNLAQALSRPEDLPDASAWQERVLEASRRLFGAEHPRTLTALGNLATIRVAQGRLPEAFTLQKEALDAYESLFGDMHPATMTAQSNLGAICKAQGDLKAARAWELRALRSRSLVFGDDHPETQSSLFALYAIVLSQKDERAVEMTEGEIARMLKRTQPSYESARTQRYFQSRRAEHGVSTE